MKKNRDVAAAWGDRGEASCEHLRSDGTSLWSYGWYEIARHVGGLIVYIRDYDEGYSAATTAHIGLALQAAARKSKRILRVSASSKCEDRARLGQPNWEWLSWCLWFDDTFGNNEYDYGACQGLYGYLKPTAKFRGKLYLSTVRNCRVKVRLWRLLPDRPGWGKLLLPTLTMREQYRLDGGNFPWIKERPRPYYKALRQEISLLDFYPEDASVLAQVVGKHAKGDKRWQHVLFPKITPRDVRKEWRSLSKNAFLFKP